MKVQLQKLTSEYMKRKNFLFLRPAVGSEIEARFTIIWMVYILN